MDVKVFTEDGALELAEKLLQNDKDIKEELEQKGYATESFVTEKIAEAQLEDKEVDLSGYAKTEDLNNYATKEHSHNEYLTEHQDLSDYALKSQIPSIEGLVSEERLTEALSPYAKTEDIPDEYDDTALSNRITTVENDYLKSSDKTELTQAIATAKTETIETILGEAVDADFDTLQEVADWIQADTTASAELVVRVTDAESDIAIIQNDYLKAVDKTELLSSISTNTTAISKNTTDIAKNTTAIEENAEAIADNATAIAVERARIDAFTALPEGSTTGDAALEDIKIKVDGTSADTAGNAVREQINTLDDKIDEEVGKLSSEIVEIKEIIPYTNILNVEDSVAGYSYDSRTGRGIEKASNANYSACNQIFNVKTGEKYTINWLYGAIYLYDSSQKLVSYNYVDSIPYTVTVAQDGYMTVAGSTSRMNDIMLVKGDTLPSEYVEYGVLNITTEQGNRLEKQIDSLNGVKWCAFGDSLTDSATLSNMTNKKNYVDYVGTSLGLDVTNCGVGGSGYMKTENRFVNRVSTIPTDAEILTVLGSFNDYEFIETNLGVFGDNGTDTIYGCMYSFFDTVFSRCPDIVVGVILPTKWGYLSPQKDSEASAKCDLYIKALTETAERFELPILDLYNHSNLRPWEDSFAERYYKDDDSNGVANTVHPLDEAHKKFIAPKVEAFIKSIYKRY